MKACFCCWNFLVFSGETLVKSSETIDFIDAAFLHDAANAFLGPSKLTTTRVKKRRATLSDSS
jgi:hypothetical protein